MDALECRSPSRCRSCEHWQGQECALEGALEATFAPPARIAVATLARADLRKAAA